MCIRNLYVTSGCGVPLQTLTLSGRDLVYLAMNSLKGSSSRAQLELMLSTLGLVERTLGMLGVRT